MSEAEFCLRVLAAFGFGAAIGFERQSHHKPAGLRTHILVAVAAAMLTASALHMSDKLNVDAEFSRIPAGILTGIGFIGAGAILKVETTVMGITTAATVFMAAALGIVAGMGLYWLALTGAGLTIFSTWGVQRLEAIFALDQNGPDQGDQPS
jgi:putative Mg2+ transporter-C (MgtC) family protein